jgi:hypothetical protein
MFYITNVSCRITRGWEAEGLEKEAKVFLDFLSRHEEFVKE